MGVEQSKSPGESSSLQKIDLACRPGSLLTMQSLSSHMQPLMASVTTTTTCGSKGCKESCGQAGNKATDTVTVDLSFLTQQFPPRNRLEADKENNALAFVECGGAAAAAAGACPAASTLLAGDGDAAGEPPMPQGGGRGRVAPVNDMPGGPAEDQAQRSVEEHNRQLDEAQERRLAKLRAEQEKLARELEELKRQQCQANQLEEERQVQSLRREQKEARAAEEQAIGWRIVAEAKGAAMEDKLRRALAKGGFASLNEKKPTKCGLISPRFQYPLHFAVEQNDPESVEVLLQAGADRGLLNSTKQTALQLALAKNDQKNSHAKVVDVLLTAAKADLARPWSNQLPQTS